MGKLSKYPQNILLLLVGLFLCIGIILFIKEYDSFNLSRVKVNEFKKSSISSIANFNLVNTVILGAKNKPLSTQTMKGNSSIKFDLINGDVKVNSINIAGKLFKINELNKQINVISIQLDPDYSSIGTVNLGTGKIDLSVGVVVEMNIDNNPKNEKISFIFPLVGKLDRNSGMLNLSGGVTIPPGKLLVPMPVGVTINAISK